MSTRFNYRTAYARGKRYVGVAARTYRYKRNATNFVRNQGSYYYSRPQMTKLNNSSVVTYRGRENMAMPNILNTKVTWSTVYTVLAAGSMPYKQLSIGMNNLNDPGGSLDSTAPMFHDNLMTMYGRYVVHACKIVVTAVSASDTTGTGDSVFGTYPSTSSAQAGNVTTLASAIVQQGCRYSSAVRYGNGGARTVKNFCKVKTLMGKKDVVDDPDFSGQSSAAPVTLPVWSLFIGSRDETSDPTAAFTIKCTYYVSYYRRDNEDLTQP